MHERTQKMWVRVNDEDWDNEGEVTICSWQR